MNIDTLPPIGMYREYLYKAITKFSINIETARKRYGLYTIEEWEKILNN